MFQKLFKGIWQSAQQIWEGYWVIMRSDGRFFNNHQWIDDWRQAERFYGSAHEGSPVRTVVAELKEKGQPCFVSHIPGSPN